MRRLAIALTVLISLLQLLHAQELKDRPLTPTPPTPQIPRALANNEETYQKLRNIGLSGEAIPVSGFRLKKDAATFTFRSGTFYLLQPVNGKTTGAVFIGDASFGIYPPTELERRYLKILSKGDEFVEQFSEAVFRFTDGAEEDLRKAASKDAPASAGGGDPSGLLHENQQQLRSHLHNNLDVRLLADVLSSQPGGKFIAFIKGKHYSGKLIFDIDQEGVVAYFPDPGPIYRGGPVVQQYFSLAPEEVALFSWDFNHEGMWTAFHFAEEYANHTADSDEQNGRFRIKHQQLDVAFEKSGRLAGAAVTTVTAQRDGVRVLALDLFPTLRVDWVAGESGEPLRFIQEDAEKDANFAIILPRELKRGEIYTVTTRYGGKDAVINEGDGNYFPYTRDKWYPNLGFGSYATYDLTLHIPKGLKMAATGRQVSNIEEGKENVTRWVSEAPLAVAGFNFGEYKTQEAEDLGHHYKIETDVNANASYQVAGLRNAFSGTMSTVPMMKKATAEAQLSLDLYTKYFGQLPYSKLEMTQQDAPNFGQGWPGLIFLPYTYFMDSTQQHSIGIGNTHQFFKVVGPHEIAHQWWGHMVGWNCYRDQWMSEGFAEFSASIVLQMVYSEKNLNDYHDFWAWERELLTRSNPGGKRAIDVGPLTLGYRLANARTGVNIPRELIYPKGAYVLQMLRMMMQQNGQDPDVKFKEMMTDFTSRYTNRPASTEDFKAVVEKHMLPYMDLAGDHKMSWFFDQYVYGTEYPKYELQYSIGKGAQGAPVLNFKLTQSKVSDNFLMVVPLYLDLGGGRFGRLGRISIKGNSTVERQVSLPRGAEGAQKLSINYLDDILAEVQQ
jgi:hypothetical protein